MARRKRLKNVQISTEELKPTTIGYLNSKQRGSFLLIFIFAALFATLHYMPIITDYVNKVFNPDLYSELKEQERPLDEDDTGVIKNLDSSLVLNINGVKFSGFAIEGNMLTFVIDSNASTGEFNNYFLETYDRDQVLLERFYLSSLSTTNLQINYSNVKAIAINQYNDDNYPNITLKDNTLICTKLDESYKFVFANDGLTKIVFSITMKQTNDNINEYNDALIKYNKESINIQNEGIENYLSKNEGEFTFTKVVNLLVAANSDLENAYAYDTKSKKIAFEMSTKGYKCN